MRIGKSAAIIMGTLLVALTPLFAYADAGHSHRSQATIEGEVLLSNVNTMMGDNYKGSNHGGIVSFAAQMDLPDLLNGLAWGTTSPAAI